MKQSKTDQKAAEYRFQEHRQAAEWSLTGLFHLTHKPWGEPELWHRDCFAAVKFLITGKSAGQMSFKEETVFAEVERVIAIARLTKVELALMVKKYEDSDDRRETEQRATVRASEEPVKGDEAESEQQRRGKE